MIHSSVTRTTLLSTALVSVLLCAICTSFSPKTAIAQDPPPLWEELFLADLSPVKYGAGVWGDFNGDGLFDLIYTGTTTAFELPTPVFDVYINGGEAERTVPNPDGGEPIVVYGINYLPLAFDDIFTDPMWRSMAAWADLNGDGRLDVIASGMNKSDQTELQIFLQNPPGQSRPFSKLPSQVGLTDGDIAIADIDNDGDQDILLAGYDGSDNPQTWILENTFSQGGSLAPIAHNIVNLGQSHFAVGDYDGDADMDVLITGLEDPQRIVTRLYRNDGVGNFTATADQFKPLLGADVDWGDFDADGDLDLLYSGGVLTPFLLEGEIAVYENLGGSFSADDVNISGAFPTDPAFGRYRGSAHWGDFKMTDTWISSSPEAVGHQKQKQDRRFRT